MKILIYGAGVIGCTYGWQLANTGCEVTLLVKEGRAKKITDEGISIRCSDFRTGEKQESEIIFRPKVIEILIQDNDFDYIIVSVNSIDLPVILPILSRSAGKAHILFFLNLWNEFEEIAKQLKPEQYSFGFPFMAGGGRNNRVIESIISGSKYSKTMLGDVNSKIIYELDKANMKPFISGQIINWLVPHYVFIAALSAGVIKAGGTMSAFFNNKQIIRDSIKAIREGFEICSKRGINPKKEKVNRLYYLPFLICIPVMKNIFSNEDMASMFDGYLKHTDREIRYMLNKIISSGKEFDVKTPYLNHLIK